MFSGIHHVALIVSDYQRSKYFYTQVLGLEVVAENFRAARDSYKLDLRVSEGVQIELFAFPEPPPRPSRPEACGLRHLAFKVEDLDAVIRHLHSHRIAVEPIRIDEIHRQALHLLYRPGWPAFGAVRDTAWHGRLSRPEARVASGFTRYARITAGTKLAVSRDA